MKKIITTAIVVLTFFSTAYGMEPLVQLGNNALLDWTGDYIEAVGEAVAPSGKENTAQGKLLAKRGAMVDLQRNLLEFIKGVQISSETSMENFMADDEVRTAVRGYIKNVAVTKAEWDGEIYSLTGRIPMKEIRKATLPAIKKESKKQKKLPPQPRPKKKSNATGLILDCRSLPLIPSVTFRILSSSGKEVYSFDRVELERFLASGLCDYHTNINWATGQPRVADSPLVIKPLKMVSPKNVDIVVSDSDAARIAALPDYVIKRCRVSIVKR